MNSSSTFHIFQQIILSGNLNLIKTDKLHLLLLSYHKVQHLFF